MPEYKKVGLVYAPQGSQDVKKMRETLIDEKGEITQTLQLADQVAREQEISSDLIDLFQKVQNEDLIPTALNQLIIGAHGVEITNQIKKLLPEIPLTAMGFSVGEWLAYHAAGVFSDAEVLTLLAIRGNGMQTACEQNPGIMRTVLGLSAEKIQEIISPISGVWITNFNTPNLILIGGETTAVELACQKLTEVGATKIIDPKTAGAFHTPLMQPAQSKVSEALKQTNLKPPAFPVLANREGGLSLDIKKSLEEQIINPVQAVNDIRFMQQLGTKVIFSIGAKTFGGKFLRDTGLTDAGIEVIDIQTPQDLVEYDWDKLEIKPQVQVPRLISESRRKIGYIIGADVITPFGHLQETFEAMLQGKSASKLLSTQDVYSLKEKERFSNTDKKTLENVFYALINNLAEVFSKNYKQLNVAEKNLLPEEEILSLELFEDKFDFIQDEKVKNELLNLYRELKKYRSITTANLQNWQTRFFLQENELDAEQIKQIQAFPGKTFFRLDLTADDFTDLPGKLREEMENLWKEFIEKDREANFLHRFPSRIGAVIPEELIEEIKKSIPPSVNKKAKTPTIWYAYNIAYRILESAGMLDEKGQIKEEFQEQTATIVGTGLGGQTGNEEGAIKGEKGSRFSHKAATFMTSSLPSMPASWVAVDLKAKGATLAPNGACATGIMALYEAMKILRDGSSDFVITEGSEETLHSINGLKGFGEMTATSRQNENPQKASNPFGLGRDGFLIGEGCGGLLVASTNGVATLKKQNSDLKIYGEVVGTGTSTCNPDIRNKRSVTEGTPEGQKKAMLIALADAGIEAKEIDLVICHGTSTPAGDIVEAQSLKMVFGEKQMPLVWAPKASGDIGHTLAAAGAHSLALGVQVLSQNKIPGMSNKNYQPDPELGINLIRENTEFQGKHILVCAWGFGGINYTAVLKRHFPDSLNQTF